MGYRSLVINGDTWLFKVGRSYLDIRGPDGRSFKPSAADVKGLTLNDFAQASIEGGPMAMVTPKDVTLWIRNHTERAMREFIDIVEGHGEREFLIAWKFPKEQDVAAGSKLHISTKSAKEARAKAREQFKTMFFAPYPKIVWVYVKGDNGWEPVE